MWSVIDPRRDVAAFRIGRFKLVAPHSPDERAEYVPPGNLPAGNPTSGVIAGMTQRIVRSTKVADAIKAIRRIAMKNWQRDGGPAVRYD